VKRRLFNAGALVSLVLLLAMIGLWARGYHHPDLWLLRAGNRPWCLQSSQGEISLIWFDSGFLHGSDEPFSPRTGWFGVGGWDILDRQDRTPPVVTYARYYVKDGFLVALLGGMAVACAWLAHRHRLRESTGKCPACGYDLRGTPTKTCPECGAASASPASPATPGKA
jgi:hypothetical protein